MRSFCAGVLALFVVAPASAEDVAKPSPPSETYMQAAPSRDAADEEGLERARREARRARIPDRIPERSTGLPSGTTCLSARDARGAIGAKRAVPLAHATRVARDAWEGEVIDYRLCSVEGLLTYDLTLLNADGKVARARIDAGSGKLLGVR